MRSTRPFPQMSMTTKTFIPKVFACRGPLTAFLWAPTAWLSVFVCDAWSRKRYRARTSWFAVGDQEQDYSNEAATVRSRATVVPHSSTGSGQGDSTATAFDSSFLATQVIATPPPEGFSENWERLGVPKVRKYVPDDTKPMLRLVTEQSGLVDLDLRTNDAAEAEDLPRPIVWFEGETRGGYVERRRAYPPSISAAGGPTFLSPMIDGKTEWVLWETPKSDREDREYQFSEATSFAIISEAQKQAICNNAGQLYEVRAAGVPGRTSSRDGDQSATPKSPSGGGARPAPKGFSKKWDGSTEKRPAVDGSEEITLSRKGHPPVPGTVVLLTEDDVSAEGSFYSAVHYSSDLEDEFSIFVDGKSLTMTAESIQMARIKATEGEEGQGEWLLWNTHDLKSRFYIISSGHKTRILKRIGARALRGWTTKVEMQQNEGSGKTPSSSSSPSPPRASDKSSRSGAEAGPSSGRKSGASSWGGADPPRGCSQAWAGPMKERPELDQSEIVTISRGGQGRASPGVQLLSKFDVRQLGSFYRAQRSSLGSEKFPVSSEGSSIALTMIATSIRMAKIVDKADWLLWNADGRDGDQQEFYIISSGHKTRILENIQMLGDEWEITEVEKQQNEGSAKTPLSPSSQPSPHPPGGSSTTSGGGGGARPPWRGRAEPPPGFSQTWDGDKEERPNADASTQVTLNRNEEGTAGVVLLPQDYAKQKPFYSATRLSSAPENEFSVVVNGKELTTTAKSIEMAKIVGKAEWLLWNTGDKLKFYIISSEHKTSILEKMEKEKKPPEQEQDPKPQKLFSFSRGWETVEPLTLNVQDGPCSQLTLQHSDSEYEPPLRRPPGYYKCTWDEESLLKKRKVSWMDGQLILDTDGENLMMLAQLREDETHKRGGFEPEWVLWKHGTDFAHPPSLSSTSSQRSPFYIISAEQMEAVRAHSSPRNPYGRYRIEEVVLGGTTGADSSSSSEGEPDAERQRPSTARPPGGGSSTSDQAAGGGRRQGDHQKAPTGPGAAGQQGAYSAGPGRAAPPDRNSRSGPDDPDPERPGPHPQSSSSEDRPQGSPREDEESPRRKHYPGAKGKRSRTAAAAANSPKEEPSGPNGGARPGPKRPQPGGSGKRDGQPSGSGSGSAGTPKTPQPGPKQSVVEVILRPKAQLDATEELTPKTSTTGGIVLLPLRNKGSAKPHFYKATCTSMPAPCEKVEIKSEAASQLHLPRAKRVRIQPLVHHHSSTAKAMEYAVWDPDQTLSSSPPGLSTPAPGPEDFEDAETFYIISAEQREMILRETEKSSDFTIKKRIPSHPCRKLTGLPADKIALCKDEMTGEDVKRFREDEKDATTDGITGSVKRRILLRWHPDKAEDPENSPFWRSMIFQYFNNMMNTNKISPPVL
ncbi:unnamed protein product [Amoebophrya sp. A25]|nr:unnamed protein product [Amoebophrya sp. A25]|eukprot:GSA25T00023752001.1